MHYSGLVFPDPVAALILIYIIITRRIIEPFVNFLADLNRYFLPDECV